MEQIIRQYGKFLFEAAVLAALAWLLFSGLMDAQGNRGVLAIAGAGLAEEDVVLQREDIMCYERECEKSAPTISYVADGILYTGEYAVEEILYASDNTGSPVAVRIESVSSPRGSVQTYTAGIENITFGECGVYTLCASAVDASNRKAVYRFTIPVNGWR